MAFDSNDIAAEGELAGTSSEAAQPLSNATRPVFNAAAALWRSFISLTWLTDGWIARTIRKSLRRRILLANLVGLLSLLCAILYLSLHHGWLLDAKVDVVKTVSRITAEAIAYRAVNERAIFDPNRLPEKTLPRAQRDDAFAALELPIDPHQAAIVLRKLVGPADLKARIYSPKGSLILNSETLFGKDDATEDTAAADNEPAPRLRNFWTRLNYWVINKELRVYRELGTANGFLYPEVKSAAQQGRETPILLLNRHGQQIVSMAEPIKRGNKNSRRPAALDQARRHRRCSVGRALVDPADTRRWRLSFPSRVRSCSNARSRDR